MLFIVVIALLCVSFFFRYPDTITAEMILTSDNPSVEAKARFTGRIMKLYVEDRQFVETGKYLAVIENSAKTEDILHLKKITTINNTVIPHRKTHTGVCPSTSCASSLRNSIF